MLSPSKSASYSASSFCDGDGLELGGFGCWHCGVACNVACVVRLRKRIQHGR